MLISHTLSENVIPDADRSDVLALTKHILRIPLLEITQDSFLNSYIDQAYSYLQGQTGIAFTAVNGIQIYDRVSQDEEIRSFRAPLVTTTRFGNFTDTMVSTAAQQRDSGWRVIANQHINGGVEIHYTAGQTSISGDIKTGISRCAARLYESRGEVLENTLFHRRRTLVL